MLALRPGAAAPAARAPLRLARRAAAAPTPAARRAPARCAAAGAASSAPPHPDAAGFAALVAASGSETSLVVAEGALGRGVFTTAPAREGDLLLRVPLRHALCVTTGGSRATVEALLKQAREFAPPPAGGGLARGGVPRALEDHLQDRKVAPAARLAAWLLWALGAAPVWRAAEPLLPPRDFRVDVAVREAPAAHAAYAAAVKADASLAVTVDDFAWALSCVASRTFGADAWTRGDRDGVLGLMVPLADFLNHRARPRRARVRARVRACLPRPSRADAAPACAQGSTPTASSGCATRRACLRSLRDAASTPVRPLRPGRLRRGEHGGYTHPHALARTRSSRNTRMHACTTRSMAGEEACISYGEDLTNGELRERYGFALENNPNGEEKKAFRDRYARMA
jgi:hypothetical protein